MRNRRGVIATITVIFVLILIIMAGVALLLWTNHARLTERQIKRMRAFYTAEAAAVRALDELRRTATVSANLIYPSIKKISFSEGKPLPAGLWLCLSEGKPLPAGLWLCLSLRLRRGGLWDGGSGFFFSVQK